MVTLNKKFKQVILFIISFLMVALLLNFILVSDKYSSKIDTFVYGNEEIRNAVGEIKGISITKKTFFEGSITEKPYRKYRLKIHGSNKNAYIYVVITDLDSVGNENISLLE